MKLIARKPCSFGGKKFYIGNEVPAELVVNPKAQEKFGVLAIVSDEEAAATPGSSPVSTMDIVIHAKEGDLPLALSKDGLQAVVDVLTSNAEEAEAIIETMEDEESLILLGAVETRKAVKTATVKRSKAIMAEESEGDQ